MQSTLESIERILLHLKAPVESISTLLSISSVFINERESVYFPKHSLKILNPSIPLPLDFQPVLKFFNHTYTVLWLIFNDDLSLNHVNLSYSLSDDIDDEVLNISINPDLKIYKSNENYQISEAENSYLLKKQIYSFLKDYKYDVESIDKVIDNKWYYPYINEDVSNFLIEGQESIQVKINMINENISFGQISSTVSFAFDHSSQLTKVKFQSTSPSIYYESSASHKNEVFVIVTNMYDASGAIADNICTFFCNSNFFKSVKLAVKDLSLTDIGQLIKLHLVLDSDVELKSSFPEFHIPSAYDFNSSEFKNRLLLIDMLIL